MLLAAALTTTGVLAWIRNRRATGFGSIGRPGRAAKAAVVGLVWIALLAVTYAAAGSIFPWYLLLPLAGWALFVGAVAEGLLGQVEREGVALRSAALAASVLLVFVLVWQASYSPLFRRYDEWQRASRAATAFLTETARRIESAAAGASVEAPPLPHWVAADPGRPTVRGAAVFADYSVRAWTELRWPDRFVRVEYAASGVRPPARGELLLLITRRRSDL